MAKKRKSKRFIILIEILAVILILASISFIIVCGLLKDNGFGDFWWPAVGIIGFFSCDLLAVFLLLRIFKDAIFYEANKQSKKYDNSNLFELKNMTTESTCKKLLEHKFSEIKTDYLRRKVFSFLKDSICYYAKSVNSTDLKSTIEYELNLMDELDERPRNVCFLLFIYKSDINESDLKELKEISKSLILNETVIPVPSCYTSIIVLIDSKTHEGKFLDMNSRRSISVYAHGCRLIKKCFS